MKLTSLLVLVFGLVAGWVIFHRGAAFPPAIIADTVTDYSPAQRLAMHQEDIQPGHMYLDDPTYIPRPISYVRVEYLAPVVKKLLPRVYVADADFEPNSWAGERVRVVDPAAMPPVFSSTADLPCAKTSDDLSAGIGGFEIRIRQGSGPLQRCLVSHDTGCRYIGTLRVLTGDVPVRRKLDGRNDLALLDHLANCPKALI